MARSKTANSSSNGAPKAARKPRTSVAKAFVVEDDEPYLVIGFTQRKVEAAVWHKPKVRAASLAETRSLPLQLDMTSLPGQARVDESRTDGAQQTAQQPGTSADVGTGADSLA